MATHLATTLYVRVARGKCTIFVYTESQETIHTLKTKVLSLINVNPKPSQISEDPNAPDKTIDDIQLRFPADVVLDNASTVSDYQIDSQTGQVVYLLFKDSEDNWEPIDVYDPEPLGVSKEQIETIKAQHALQTPSA